MELTPELREQVRLSLLRYGLAPAGFTLGLGRAYLKSEGFRQLTIDQVQAEIDYLDHPQKGFLEATNKRISPEVAIYRTTPNGLDYLAQQREERA